MLLGCLNQARGRIEADFRRASFLKDARRFVYSVIMGQVCL